MISSTLISFIVIAVIIFAVVVIAVSQMVIIVQQGEVKVVESFGKYVRTLDPGLHFLVPVLYNVRQRVSLKQTPLEIPPQSVITKDNVIINIDEALKYHVTDARAFVYDNQDSVLSMVQDCQSNLRGIIGKMDLNEVLNGTEEINQALFASVQHITAGYGLSIDRINIGEIKVSQEIVDSMNKLITASRDKESMITVSEGKKQSVILDSEARASEMEIDAEARAKQTKIDAEARAERMRIDAEAEAAKIRTLAEADKQRIQTINTAIRESGIDENVLSYLGIQAFKEVARSNTNTVILPSNMTELGNVPVVKALWDSENEKHD
ncbi:Regulator of protease activity HflC, stomatin/prohibitin superfamily [Pilibacter termitis]|uniref:Regulator of protease activity HflC, stomatin/prohibitin superfamily n=1 Tax=Pilibacter termitis TaxID=263852 RepID=A0A1T4QET6_9ENTE|nr:SPFH domain-containing protein [Pilibacter termitis]SKA02215.1 Regulator of protease activity HflC, stomatin/prohibitin superfamily [Pilibacter termitis]